MRTIKSTELLQVCNNIVPTSTIHHGICTPSVSLSSQAAVSLWVVKVNWIQTGGGRGEREEEEHLKTCGILIASSVVTCPNRTMAPIVIHSTTTTFRQGMERANGTGSPNSGLSFGFALHIIKKKYCPDVSSLFLSLSLFLNCTWVEDGPKGGDKTWNMFKWWLRRIPFAYFKSASGWMVAWITAAAAAAIPWDHSRGFQFHRSPNPIKKNPRNN